MRDSWKLQEYYRQNQYQIRREMMDRKVSYYFLAFAAGFTLIFLGLVTL